MKKEFDLEDKENSSQKQENIIHVSGMYKNWFLDYASYVILDRSVPYIQDGLKPVQRRILHSLKQLDDGRYHKVANVIGHTMKYHPHGDASIGDAMVQIGNKNLLLDMQGNWGNVATGDKAAAARYIEVRLTNFALDVVFNNKITEWISSYDGRGKEPVALPIKFPLLLAHGVEGIAVGLSTKIMPHNFNELIDASIKVLKGVKPKILPDFSSGGLADFSDYNDGNRGGKIRIRAKIIQKDKNILVIKEIPFSTTTTSLINSILKANDKGKIKIKKIEDNTSEDVEILISLPSGISPDKTIDALYTFTDCELSISPLACVINDDQPQFLGVSEILQKSTSHTLELLEKELRVNLEELQNKWHSLSLERIFIENRIYHKIEDLEEWELVISTINHELKPFISHLLREVNRDDIIKLTEIKIKRITKFDLNKAEEEILKLEDKIRSVKYNLENLVEFAINYFKDLKKKYGKGRERKTEIKTFENIVASKVVVANKKLFVNREEGFVGTSLRKDEYLSECSDIDDIVAFKKDGTFMVSKVGSKVFMGKGIIHCAVFKKKDNRTVYNMIYKDETTSTNYIKRFSVTSITRNKDYNLCKNDNGNKVLYFTSNPNGEAELVSVYLRSLGKLKKLKFDADFSKISIKGRSSGGNILTKNSIKKIEFKSEGFSTLEARKIWFDSTINRLNVDNRGLLLGDFQSEDKLLTINKKGEIQITSTDLSTHFDDSIIIIEKLIHKKPISAIYYNGDKQSYFIKRFITNEISNGKFSFIGMHKNSELLLVSTDYRPVAEVIFNKEKGKDRKSQIINIEKFISIKGWKSLGNKLTNKKIKEIKWLESLPNDLINEVNNSEESTKNVGQNKIDKELIKNDALKNKPNVSDEGAQQISLDL
tara:strand:- start:15538 stop:18189 length:2652 start_codon:yes stop_codon:yes gene_type:complete